MGFLCILAQVIGAVLGLQFLKFLTPDIIFQQSCGQFGMCQTYPHEGIDTFGTLLCEYVATMILIFICCAAWDPCNQSKQDSTPIKFGLAITVICIIFVSMLFVFTFISNNCFLFQFLRVHSPAAQ